MPGRTWKPASAPKLPDGIVLFDGYCHVCSGGVQFLLARDRDLQFTYVPCQSPWGYEIMARYGIDRDFALRLAECEGGSALETESGTVVPMRLLYRGRLTLADATLGGLAATLDLPAAL